MNGVNGSPGAGGDRARFLADALGDAREGSTWLEEHEPDHELAGRMRATVVSAWGRVLRFAAPGSDELAEAQGALDDLQREALARELGRWSSALVEHGFLDCELDPESLRVLAQARLDDLPVGARWARHREHRGNG